MVTAYVWLGYLQLPQNLPEQGFPKYTGPAWEAKGRPDPLAFPKSLEKEGGFLESEYTGSRSDPLLDCMSAEPVGLELSQEGWAENVSRGAANIQRILARV